VIDDDRPSVAAVTRDGGAKVSAVRVRVIQSVGHSWRSLFRVGIGGEFEEERRAAALVVHIADHAAVRVDDAVAHRQAEAGALPDWLRREERLE
jgi:hypothetical protein